MYLKWKIRDINSIQQTEYENALNNMDPKRKARILKFRFEDDVRRSAAGDILIKELLEEYMQTDKTDVHVVNSENGKPFLDNLNMQISISHSGNFCAAAICNIPCGIDIEVIRPIDLKITKKICNDKEKNYIFYHEPKDNEYLMTDNKKILTRFFKVWTIKEACVKCTGIGLEGISNINSIPLLEKSRENDKYIFSLVTHEDLNKIKK